MMDARRLADTELRRVVGGHPQLDDVWSVRRVPLLAMIVLLPCCSGFLHHPPVSWVAQCYAIGMGCSTRVRCVLSCALRRVPSPAMLLVVLLAMVSRGGGAGTNPLPIGSLCREELDQKYADEHAARRP